MIIDLIRMILGSVLLIISLAIFIFEVWGVFSMKYVLNRMHIAAMGDTLGIGCCVLGLMIISGFSFATLKLALIIVFFWLASPVCSHMLARLEVSVNERLSDNLEALTLEELQAFGAEDENKKEEK